MLQMAELEEGNIANHGSGSFEISQKSDDSTALSSIQSGYVCF